MVYYDLHVQRRDVFIRKRANVIKLLIIVAENPQVAFRHQQNLTNLCNRLTVASTMRELSSIETAINRIIVKK